ncbi:site-specific integrase [Streptomyces sp. NPDC048428]|uniref:tyrosine-type recombinase/integrase n=1 Tax=Streptomyces sp. NPDC048428 TaxID=3154503 RepID=UPI003449CBB1
MRAGARFAITVRVPGREDRRGETLAGSCHGPRTCTFADLGRSLAATPLGSPRLPDRSGTRGTRVVGLRWENLDLEKREIRLRTQRQRVRGEAHEDDAKGRRRKQTLPLPAICVAPHRWQRMRQAAMRGAAGEKWEETGYVFTTRTGHPIEPRNLYRSFTRVAGTAGLRVIRLHDARHGCATLLTAAGVAPRVVMEILGHSQIAVTMNIYAHVVQDTQREAVSHLDRMLKRQRPDRG